MPSATYVTLSISGTLFDDNNVYLDRNDSFIGSIAAGELFGSTKKYDCKFSYEVSSSIEVGESAEMTGTLAFNAGGTQIVASTDATSQFFSAPYVKRALGNGWTKYEVDVSDKSFSFPLSLVGSTSNKKTVYWTLDIYTSSTSVHPFTGSIFFRNLKFDFLEPLSDSGVKYYKNLDNQNVEKFNICVDVLKKIE